MAERHFLADVIGDQPTFSPEPWYNPHGDCLVCKKANEASIADRIDECLTIYRSVDDKRPIGFQIKGVCAMIQKFGFAGLAIACESTTESVKSVSIAALLLAAYEDRPFTLGRRLGYAEAMECEHCVSSRRIPFGELHPA
ncbi:MAG: hypothetical protein KJ749_10875 [Planctomycetes bacterium]|nr:hypothetical protein [Planctomycetota bacterium]